MSSDRYDDHHMTGAHLDQPMSAEERRLMSMTSEEREEHINRLQHAAKVAEHNEKEAALQAKVRAATEVALAGNQFYQMQRKGQLSERVTVQNGRTTYEQLNAPVNMGRDNQITAPQALVDQLPIFVGGIQLGPQQAKEMMLRGEISERD